MQVCSENYVFSHGKAPRGRGTWAFAFGRSGAWTEEFCPGCVSYSEAKRWALSFARQLGADQVFVCP